MRLVGAQLMSDRTREITGKDVAAPDSGKCRRICSPIIGTGIPQPDIHFGPQNLDIYFHLGNDSKIGNDDERGKNPRVAENKDTMREYTLLRMSKVDIVL